MLSWQSRHTVMLSFRVQHWRRSTSGRLRIWDPLPFICPWTYWGSSLPSCRSSGKLLGHQWLSRWLKVRRSRVQIPGGNKNFWKIPRITLDATALHKRNFVQCKTGESTSMMVWPTLSRTAKEQNRSHAKHESGLIVTDVLWSHSRSVGHDCVPCKSRWTDRNAVWGEWPETSETYGIIILDGCILEQPGEYDWMIVYGSDVALCQITLTTCYILRAHLMRAIAYFFLAYRLNALWIEY